LFINSILQQFLIIRQITQLAMQSVTQHFLVCK